MMRIGVRLSILLVVPILFILLLSGWLTERESRQLLRDELARAGRSIALVTQIAMEDYTRDHRIDDARELVDRISGHERVLGFRLFHQDGSLIYESSPPTDALPVDPGQLKDVLATGRQSETRSFVGREPLVSFLVPLKTNEGASEGAVQIMLRESILEEATRASRRAFLTLTAAVTIATVGLLLIVTRFSVTRPIEELVASVRDVGSGDLLTARVAVRRRDEIGRLASEFNRMCERLTKSQRALFEEQEERHRTETSLRRAERLASVGRLAAAFAHEIGTPLNVIGGRAESLLKRVEGDEVSRKSLRIVIAQMDRITRIVRGLLDFARARESRIAPTRLDQVVSRVFDLVEIQMQKHKVTFDMHIPADLPLVAGDADQLHQVFLNLATNALDAMPSGGHLAVRARCGPWDSSPDGFLTVQVEDTGVGIPPENVGRVFDPFFTTKDVGAGTGLGLSVAYGIVREHGGWIDVESVVGHGTCVSVHLPVAEVPAGDLS